MPLTAYTSTFDPEALQTLQQAFDNAWREVGASRSVQVDEDEARKMLAQRIVAAWRDHGEREPERLIRYAVQGL